MVFKKKCHIDGIIHGLTQTSFFNPCPILKVILKTVAIFFCLRAAYIKTMKFFSLSFSI